MIRKQLKNWKAFELLVADFLEGKRQDGSGLSPIASKKGDVKAGKFLVECKSTAKPAYVLKSKTFQKIVEQALQAQKVPLMAISVPGAQFFVSLACDEAEPDFPEEKLSLSATVHLWSAFIPEKTVVKHSLCFPDKPGHYYDLCIWQFDTEDQNTRPKEQ